jgi:hypothetical protein
MKSKDFREIDPFVEEIIRFVEDKPVLILV